MNNNLKMSYSKGTIKEIKEQYKGEYADIEVYSPTNRGEHYPNHFHTDNCNWCEDGKYNDDTEIGLVQLMDNETYNNTIEANSCVTSDFVEIYGDKNAKVLCLMTN